ncbi:MAG: hypothetical protein ACRED5_12975 [Propylenella sp.]
MIKTLPSGILISTIAISLSIAAAALPAAPLSANADAAERIDDAFASLSANVDPPGANAAIRSPKGDLPRPSGCASVIWPNIDASCLSTTDGSPAPNVRTITIGYRSGVNTTVLLHIPAAEVAQR